MSYVSTLMEQGSKFEMQIAFVLKRAFSYGSYVLNLALYSYQLKTDTQLDLVFVTERAIYVIEAKNWPIQIKGDYNDYNWVGIGSSRKIMKVVSPFLQNALHCRTLKNAAYRAGQILPPIYNFICVPDSTAIMSDVDEVVHLDDLVERITALECTLPQVATMDDVLVRLRKVVKMK